MTTLIAVDNAATDGGDFVVTIWFLPNSDGDTKTCQSFDFTYQFRLVGNFQNNQVRMFDLMRNETSTFCLNNCMTALHGPLSER